MGPLFKTLRCLPLLVAASSPMLEAQLAHRQAAVTVRVENQTGTPLPGAMVRVEMLNPAFRFGTAVAAAKVEPGNTAFDARTVEALQKYFNSITYENALKWTQFESRSAARNLDLVQTAYALRAFDGPDPMRQRGHSTAWGAQAFVPADVRAMTDPAILRPRLLNHITTYHTLLAGQGIDSFDLYNEPFSERALIIDKLAPGGTRAQEAAEIATWFQRAKQADPNAPLFINEYNLLNFWQENDARIRDYKELIDLVRDAGGPIDGIGVQGHMDRFTTKAQITRRLDILAAPMAPTAAHPQGLPGLPIEVTELDINTQQWTTATPAQQAEVTANVLDAAFEHPAVQGVTIWVINDRAHWRGNAIMFDDADPNNWQLKPSGQVWIDRVKGAWWTNASGLAQLDGTFLTQAFKGRHRITVEYQGQTREIIREISDATEITVQLHAAPLETTRSRLTNLSVRSPLLANQNLIIGFTVHGGEMPVLIRAAGPSLSPFLPGQTGGMPDPRFTLHQMPGGTQIGENDNWPPALEPAFASVGAFPFVAGSLDAAAAGNLAGGNTAIITGAAGGIVLVEAYERPTAAGTAKLVNLSVRNRVGTGENVLIAGFYVGGTGHKRLLIRAVGPTLGETYGVPDVLADPFLELHRINPGGGSTVLQANDDWPSELAGVFAQAGAFPLLAASKDSAVVVVLEAGSAYTAIVSGVGGGAGEALVEVYELP